MGCKSRICRLCMRYNNINNVVADEQIHSKIRDCLQIDIDPAGSKLPVSVCCTCARSVRKFYLFRKECWKVQRMLISKLRHQDFIEIVNVANINLPFRENVGSEFEGKRPCSFRTRLKKEMIIEIQEVENQSPVSTASSKEPQCAEPVPEIINSEPVAKTTQLEEAKTILVEIHPLNNNDAAKKTLEQPSEPARIPAANVMSRSTKPDQIPLKPEHVDGRSSEPEDTKYLDDQSFEPDDTGAISPGSISPGGLEVASSSPEAVKTESTQLDALETWDAESPEPECFKSDDADTALVDDKSHLKPHDYTTKQPHNIIQDIPKLRTRPRRRTSHISGKALYKSLLMACDTCGKMIERNRLEGHRNKHMGIRPYSCPNESCNASFHCKHARRLHVRCRHGNESFSCDICGKVYRARRDLLGHIREAHSEPKFDCDICSKKFTTRSRLKQHRFYHTGERNHPCAFCTMTFFNNFQLKVHMRTHTQARPFICKVCKKTFRYRHMAKDHIVRHHGIDEALEKDWIIHDPEPEVSELLSLVGSNSKN